MASRVPSGNWQAHAQMDKERYCLGTFETKKRAELAERLFRLWRDRGKIMPAKPKTVDAV